MAETIIKMTGGVIRQQKNTILKDVNLDIQSGEFIYLIGKVGSGKSSLLKTLYAELPLDYGTAEVAGFQLKKIKKSHIPLLRRKCGIVFQDFRLLTDRNVSANLEFVLKATGWKTKKSIRERIDMVLEKVGMSDKKDKMPHQLSGGEQQRIVLARALLNAPPIILADEPTGNIDPETSYRLVELLKDLADSGKTVIIATHQYDLIERYPGRVLCCEDGKLYEKNEKHPVCDCIEEENPIQDVIPPVGIPSEDVKEEIPEEKIEDIAVEEIVITETITETIIIEETPVSPEENQTEELIGEEPLPPIIQMDYPEITAFDYELAEQYEIPVEKEERQQESVEVPEEKEEVSDIEKEEREEENKKKDSEPPVFDLELID